MSADERRGELRGVREERLFVKVLDCEVNPEVTDTTLSSSTLDVSASGMRLVLSGEVPAGTLLELWVEIRGCPGKFLLTGKVKWCRANGEDFICGVELIDNGEESDWGDWQDLFI
ncbi:MAG: PilZ domain-containing protein [Pseudomonadales bacterium]|nr:PilZ domain-containing protein [Pseudomonadales bacterium]MCP5214702.1 PilZ domain-containing protein [Pseudomonadales bacterium]